MVLTKRNCYLGIKKPPFPYKQPVYIPYLTIEDIVITMTEEKKNIPPLSTPNFICLSLTRHVNRSPEDPITNYNSRTFAETKKKKTHPIGSYYYGHLCDRPKKKNPQKPRDVSTLYSVNHTQFLRFTARQRRYKNS